MKRTISYLFAALTLFAAASCTKDIQPNELNDGQSELRTIELSFEDSGITKVGVSDRTPQWEAGDKVWISNGTTSEEVTLAAEDITANVAKISTSLSGTLYAVYPASAQNGVSEGKIGFKIPTSTDGAFGNAHIAVAQGTTALTFKNVVSILKITTEAATTLVNISSASAIAGEFEVTYDTRAIEAGTTQTNCINITSSAASEKYVAVASGVAFNALEFTAVKTATDWATKKSAQTSTTGINTIYDMGSVSTWGLSYVTNGSLWAKFSVAADKQVRFSKGNLQATCTAAGAEGTSTYSWAFAEHQYDYIGNAKGNTTIGSQTEGSKVDLFGWVGTSGTLTGEATKYGISTSTTNTDYSNTKPDALNDWGTTIDNKGTWRILSKDEWTYLLNTTGAASGARTDVNRFAKANVNSVNGLIIFPDGYTTVPSDAGIAAVNTLKATYPTTSIATETWSSMESAGCVFLPVTGYRNGSSVYSSVKSGYYWSSTLYMKTRPYYLTFSNSEVNPSGSNGCSRGCSVRLVSAAQ